MAWYAASVVVGYFFRSQRIDPVSVEENVVLIDAEDRETAMGSALKLGLNYAVDDPTLEIDGKPAVAQFIGIRKLVEICGPVNTTSDEPIHGAEISYFTYTVENRSDLDALMRGEAVRIRLDE